MTEELKDPLNIQEKKKEIERLLESPAWRMINTSIQAQVDTLQQEILFAPVESEAMLYQLERKKGMLEGRLSLVNTVMAMVEELEVDLSRALNEEK